MERELALTRRELEAVRREQRSVQSTTPSVEEEHSREESIIGNVAANTGDVANVPIQADRPRVNIATIADLLNNFNGKSSDYETWEKQVKLLRLTYKLDDDAARILIGLRLKGKALEWFHSKPEHITMTFDNLLDELKAMFYRRRNKIMTRKRFEERIWKHDETFHEYYHEKVILGNRVPIDDDEVLEYVIDGIPDDTLRNQARIQRFLTTENLLEAFEKVTLRNRGGSGTSSSTKPDNRNKSRQQHAAKDDETKKTSTRVMRCYNCGERDHVGTNCPTKKQGTKCFKCGERGHVASKCSSKLKENNENCAVFGVSGRKYYKDILLNDREVNALIDSGSNLSMIREDAYIALGSPHLQPTDLRFSGIGSDDIPSLGKFEAKITVDGHSYIVCIQVVSNDVLKHNLLVGANFLNTVDVRLRGHNVTICPIPGTTYVIGENKDALPEIFKIDITRDEARESNSVDILHIKDSNQQLAIENLISSYQPHKICEPDITMKLVLKNEEPIYQPARRLLALEREIVKKQIDEWIADGIVRPSTSDFASPVVLVHKKDDTFRLCVDYRRINKQIVKDRYPLPLIEDQLDRLQGARVFSTLDLRNGFFHVRVEESSQNIRPLLYQTAIMNSGEFLLVYAIRPQCSKDL